eukprot:scaffold62580_cov69-Phaeocystis_antarctica.AAC.2
MVCPQSPGHATPQRVSTSRGVCRVSCAGVHKIHKYTSPQLPAWGRVRDDHTAHVPGQTLRARSAPPTVEHGVGEHTVKG